MKIPHFSLSELSLTVRFLTVSDVVLGASLGLFAPIFAVYLAEQINTTNALQVIGVGTAIYLFTKSLGQIPLAYIIDKIKGEKDDWVFLLWGNTIFIIVPILYIFITEPWHLYTIQFFYGLGSALTFPAWYAIFTRHIDKGKEGMEWGTYQTFVDMAAAVAAPVGAIVAAMHGFPTVMISASVLAAISSVFIYFVRGDLKVK